MSLSIITNPAICIRSVTCYGPSCGRWSPYALDLWEHDVGAWLPSAPGPSEIRKQTFYGGLYQKLMITVPISSDAACKLDHDE